MSDTPEHEQRNYYLPMIELPADVSERVPAGTYLHGPSVVAMMHHLSETACPNGDEHVQAHFLEVAAALGRGVARGGVLYPEDR